MNDYDQQELGTMTVRCILCRGLVIYKDGDMTRFSSHLANEHGAFFDVEYLLASCFMDENQKRVIANPVLGVSEIPVSTHSNVKMEKPGMETVDQLEAWKQSIIDPVESSQLPGPVEDSPMLQPEVPLDASAEEVINDQKDNADPKRRHCDHCDKSYSRNEALKKHILKAHGPSTNMEVSNVIAEAPETVNEASEAVDDFTNETSEAMDDSTNEVTDHSTLTDSAFEESFDAAADSLMESLDKELMDLENGITADEKPDKVEDKIENSENSEITETAKTKKEIPKQKRESYQNYEAIAEKLLSEGIDFKKSAYFTKTRQVITSVANNEAKFTEGISFLPEGWKIRTLEAKDKGKVVTHKHYLTPTKFVLKATMAVVEYLRLEGRIKPEEILKIAENLRVGPKKLKKLFANESSEDSTPNEETVAEA